MGIEVWVSTGAGGPDDWRAEFEYWQRVGVSHITVNSNYDRGYHTRIARHTLSDHIEAITQYRAAVADLL